MTAILSALSAIGGAFKAIFRWMFIRNIQKQTEARYDAERRADNAQALRQADKKYLDLDKAYGDAYRHYFPEEYETLDTNPYIRSEDDE